MSKRQRLDEEGSTKRRRPHLYLVVGDWSGGFSIHKVDVAGFNGEPGVDLDAQADCLSDPPVFRLESSNPYPSFAAVGSKIVAMSYQNEKDAPVLLYDTATGGLAVGPSQPAQLELIRDLVPAARDRLYATGSTIQARNGHLEELLMDVKGDWAWNIVPLPPFSLSRVACYAAHPNGRTVFFSAYNSGTYSFDTQTHEWKHHGDWMLPFKGCAYYDDEVDAWVGLHQDPVTFKPERVCSCDVVLVDNGGRPPAWKVAKEKMVCEDGDRIWRIGLASMGGGGMFCLVEQRLRKGAPDDVLDTCYLFYVTSFRLPYDKNGGLEATARRTRCYMVPRELTDYSWWVFGV